MKPIALREPLLSAQASTPRSLLALYVDQRSRNTDEGWRAADVPRPHPETSGVGQSGMTEQHRRANSWATSTSNALPIALMNLAQAYTYSQLICKGTGLSPSYVAAMHIVGLLVVQVCTACAMSATARTPGMQH